MSAAAGAAAAAAGAAAAASASGGCSEAEIPLWLAVPLLVVAGAVVLGALWAAIELWLDR